MSSIREQQMRTEPHRFAGVEVKVRFPVFGIDHDRFGGQVVTVIVPGHEERPLRYVIGRSRLPGTPPDTTEGQDAAFRCLKYRIHADVKDVLAGKYVAAQEMALQGS